jgi:hypothetical protein
MALRYAFRNVFYKGGINKRRLYQILQDIDDKADPSSTPLTQILNRLNTVQTAIGSEDKEGTILARLKALEDKE